MDSAPMDNIKSDYFFYTLASVVSVISALFISILISNYFGAYGVGLINGLKLMSVVIFTLFSFGIPLGTMFISNENKFNCINSTFFLNSFVLSLFITILFSVFHDNFSIYLFSKNYKVNTWIIIVYISLYFFNNMYSNIFRCSREELKYCAVNMSRSLISIIVSFVICYTNSINLIQWILLLPEVTLFLYLIGSFIDFPKSTYSVSLTVESIKFGIKGHIGNVFAYLNVRLDQILISYFLPLENLGIYSLSVNFSECLIIGQRSIGNANLSHAIHNKTKINIFRINKLFWKMFILNCILFAIAVPIVFYFSPIIFGNEFQDVYKVFILLIPGSIMLGCSTILSTTITGYGYPQLASIPNVLSSFIAITLLFIYLSKYGIYSAAIISSLSYIIQCLLMVYFFNKVKREWKI